MRCPVHLSVGQELTSVIFSIFQTSSDFAVSTHRAHAHYIAKGGNLKSMLAEIFGKETGCSKGRGGSMHLSDPTVNFMGSSAIVGNSIPVGVGIAYGQKLQSSKSRSFIFLGDGATEEGVFFESMNFAILHELPTIFICENNFYSVYTNLQERQPNNRRLSELARAIGMRAVSIKFGNLESLFDAFEELVGSSEEGPSLIEIETYRWLEHCGPNSDDELGYRKSSELENYLEYDVVEDLKSRILLLGIGYQEVIRKIEREIHQEVSSAFEFARNSPFPEANSSKGDYYDW
jgi:pyruvate dehydrogenase E1 component alpha subunit